MSLQNLFVAKLPRNLTDADLQQIFSDFHPSSAKIMLDAATGKSKGFGFVLFDSEEQGGAAYNALNRKSTRACGHNFTLVIYPSNHDGKAANEASTALYIRNIPMTVSQERVEYFLRSFGKLTYCAMREDHYGCPVWVVYAEYQSIEDAKNALQKLHGNNTYFHGSAPILAKFEDSDEAKRERRRRRDGVGQPSTHNGPNSGCLFPPPRASTNVSIGSADDVGADGKSDPCYPSSAPSMYSGILGRPFPGGSNGTASRHYHQHSHRHPPQHSMPCILHGNVLPPHAMATNGTSSLPLQSVASSIPSGGTSAGSPPPYRVPYSGDGVGEREVTPVSGIPGPFSLPPQLLQPTPGFCYTLSDSGQQIFIPATSLGSPVQQGSGPFIAQQVQSAPVMGATGGGGNSSAMTLLNPESQNTVVLLDGGQQFVLAKDTINVPVLSSNSNRMLVSSTPPHGSIASNPAGDASLPLSVGTGGSAPQMVLMPFNQTFVL